MADTVLLPNGRHASLTEAGWEVWPRTTDKQEFIFPNIKAVTDWGSTHDEDGKQIVTAVAEMEGDK